MTKQSPKIYFNPEPDPLESKVRIGCGSLLGLFFGLFVAFRWFFNSSGVISTIAIVVVFVCLFAYLALRYGDYFWKEFLKIFPWL
jgi:ABC-type uncharacterized transport system permease subunit